MYEAENVEKYSCAGPFLIQLLNTRVICYSEILWLVCRLAELYVAALLFCRQTVELELLFGI